MSTYRVGLVVPAHGGYSGFAHPATRETLQQMGDRTKRERDELLAALKAIVDEADDPSIALEREHHPDWLPPALRSARELIKRIEEGGTND